MLLQLMVAARKRMDGRRAQEVAARAFAEADAGIARIGEVEKTFTSQACVACWPPWQFFLQHRGCSSW